MSITVEVSVVSRKFWMESKESDSMLSSSPDELISAPSPRIEDEEIQNISQQIESLSKQRTSAAQTLVDRAISRTLSGRKYEKYSHMGDVVDEVLTRTGLTLQEISRLNESYIDTAERSAYGTLQKVNDYRVLAELARGSFGIVYLVEDDRKKRYAMKAFPFAKAKKTFGRGRLPPSASASATSNDELDVIRREIALMKKLIHPYIVRLFEVVEERIYPHSIYMILEYINGGPIMILKQPPSTPGLVRDISISSVTSEHAISNYAPQWESTLTNGVLGEALASKLFRDLKPENILVTLDGDIKVVDFGVSYDFGNDNTAGYVRDTKGSWPFWSPEMIDNLSAKAYSAYSADVWAAGVCLWIFVYGTLPFWAPGPSHLPDPIFEQILTAKEAPPKFPSRRSPELCDLLLDIFTVTPEKRPTFQDLSKYAWIQLHSEVDIETRLNAFSSVSVDCSDIHLDATTAVTPGEVNFLSDNAKSHFVKMARRIREKVRARHQHLIEAKDEEIQTKREEMKHFDPVPVSMPPPPPPTITTTSSPKAPSSPQQQHYQPLPPSTIVDDKPNFSSSQNEVKIQSSPKVSHRPQAAPTDTPKSPSLGRDFSVQSNWTTQSDLEGSEMKSLTASSQPKNNSSGGGKNSSKKNDSCCSIQ